MNDGTTHRPSYNFWLLNIAAYLTLLTVVLPILQKISPGRERTVLIVLFLAFALLLAFFLQTENRPVLVYGYLAAQTALILAIFLSNPAVTTGVPVLFFVLSAQAMLFLPLTAGIGWIVAFTLLTWGGTVYAVGLSALVEMLTIGGGFAFFGSFGAILRQANQERERSQALLAELQAAHSRLKDYAQQVAELAVAEERNRLAREMHDALGHRLTVAVVQLEGSQRLIPNDPGRAAQMVGAMREQLKEALTELRQTVAQLRADSATDRPLTDSLRQLALSFQEATGLPVQLALPTDFPSLPAGQRLALYRAAQEGLTNVHKHAQAKQLWLTLSPSDGQLSLVIEDDGLGLSPDLVPGRYGLRGLQERAEQLGGACNCYTRPGGGTQLHFQIPLTPTP